MRAFTSIAQARQIARGVLPPAVWHYIDGGKEAEQASPENEAAFARLLLDVPVALSALPAIAEAVGDRCEVLLDGGIRRGADIVKARAVGARAVLIGRAWLWGLAVGGEPGVDRVLSLFRRSLAGTIANLDRAGIDAVDASVLWRA